MRTRTPPDVLLADAVEAFVDAVSSLGLSAGAPSTVGRRPRVEVTPPGGDPVEVEISASSVLTSGSPQFASGHSEGRMVGLVVADQVPMALRSVLNDAGHGWLDRRGHLRLVGGGLFIDADIPPSPRAAVARANPAPITGRSGLAAAAALLVRPDDPATVTETARLAGLNPSSVSRALATIAEAQLAEQVDRGRYRPLIPELFWSLADVWPGDSLAVSLTTEDLDDPRLGANVGAADGTGWALGGERGAVAWEAPLVLTADYPTLLYVPGEDTLRVVRAIGDSNVLFSGSRSGSASGSRTRSASGSRTASRTASSSGRRSSIALRVDPTGLVTHIRYPAPRGVLPLTHPLFCALDLASTSRGREALDQWDPPEGFTRVW